MTQNWGTRRGLPHGRGTRLVVTYNLQDLSGVQYFLIYCVYRCEAEQLKCDLTIHQTYPNLSLTTFTPVLNGSQIFLIGLKWYFHLQCRDISNRCATCRLQFRWSLRCLILSNLLCIPVWGRTSEMRLDHSPNIWQWASTRTRQLNSTWIEVLVETKAYSR